MFEKNNWTKENYEIISSMLEKYKSSKDLDKYKRNYVVTDWDNTSAAFDIQENTVLYQSISLTYSCNVDEFKELIYKDLKDDDLDDDMKVLLSDLIDDYEYLYERGLNLELLKDDPVYKDFVAKFAYFMYVFVNSLNYARSARKFLHVFYRMTEEELRNLTRNTINYFKDYKNYRMNFKFKLSNGKNMEFDYKVGLREIKEQVNLFNCFRENNIDLYICSASSMILVEEFSASELFPYNFKADEVIGLLQKKDDDSRYTLDFIENNLTYLEGKANFISSLEELYNKPPILYMGDSIGDYYALSYPGLKFALILEDPESISFVDLKNKIKALNNETVYMYEIKDPITGLFTEKNI